MKVQYITEPLNAYVFSAYEQGLGFEELQQQVIEDGGTVERVAADVVNIFINDQLIQLQSGYATVYDNGNIITYPIEVFRERYTEVVNQHLAIQNINQKLEKIEQILLQIQQTTINNGNTDISTEEPKRTRRKSNQTQSEHNEQSEQE